MYGPCLHRDLFTAFPPIMRMFPPTLPPPQRAASHTAKKTLEGERESNLIWLRAAYVSPRIQPLSQVPQASSFECRTRLPTLLPVRSACSSIPSPLPPLPSPLQLPSHDFPRPGEEFLSIIFSRWNQQSGSSDFIYIFTLPQFSEITPSASRTDVFPLLDNPPLTGHGLNFRCKSFSCAPVAPQYRNTPLYWMGGGRLKVEVFFLRLETQGLVMSQFSPFRWPTALLSLLISPIFLNPFPLHLF